MKNPSYAARPAGFSLIEVLIAVVVLSFGLLALAALQGSLFKASAEAKAQSIGLGLATEKLEYFRGFRDLTAYRNIDSGSDASTVNVGGVNYTRSWTVNRYAFRNADKTFVSVGNTGALSTTTYAENNEFKRILVNVTWTNAENAAQRVSLEAAVAALDPSDSAKLGKLTTGSLPRGPEVRIYNPTMQQQGVIPIAIGNGTDTAATNPKPLVNSSSVIETRFDVLTYNDLVGNTAVAQSRVETALLGCSCSYGNPVSGAMRPTYWDGTRYTIPESSTAVAGSGYGSIAGPDPSASAQSSLCTICCRDHHDPSTLPAGAARFDPRDTTHPSGHQLLNTSTGALSSTRAATGTYTETCRVIRVGGLYRVAADTYNDYQNFLDTKNDASSAPYLPTAAATTNYQNFVKSYLRARVVTPSGQSSWNNVLPVTSPTTVAALESANSVYATQPTEVTYRQNDDPKWLHLRGLYVDYLEAKALQAIKDAKDNCQGTGSGGAVTSSDLDSCVLKVLPFTSINLTELGIYRPLNASQTGGGQIVVANLNFADTLSATAPIRGKVTRVTGATGGTVNATAAMHSSNSGLVSWNGFNGQLVGIDTVDAGTSSPATWTATQPYSIIGSGGGGNNESFTANFWSPNTSTAYPFTSNTRTPYINSSLAGLTCTTSGQNPYTCTPGSTPLGSQSLTIGNYNYQTTGSSTTTLSCTNGLGGTLSYSGPYTTKICRNYSVSSVTQNGSVVVAGPLTPNGTDGLLSETTTIPSIAIANGDVIGIIFGTPVDTQQANTCTYTTVTTCNKGGNNCSTSNVFTVTANDCSP